MESRILEINLISAQGIKSPPHNVRRLQTYAVTWVNPAAKLRTRLDSTGGENPTWNDKFLFRVSDEFLTRDTSAVSVEIFAVGCIKDVPIGTVRFLLSSCLKGVCRGEAIGTPAFTAVQIQRPSGRFQGVLNIAAAVHNSWDFPILEKATAVSFRELMGKKSRRLSMGGGSSRYSSGGESDADSTTSSSSTASSTVLKEWNCIRRIKSDGGGMLCGLMMKGAPSDENVDNLSKHD